MDSEGQRGGTSVPDITTKDGARIHYKDWGSGQAVVFSHGWPLCSDAFEDQMFFLASRGYRCIAHDRRGHGRSSQPWVGNDMDTYADDLAALADALDLRGAVHVGHSTGGGEVARYIGRHGTKRVAKAVLIGATPPLMLKTAANPDGLPIATFDQIRAGVLADRSQFFKDLTTPFYGFNRQGAKVSEGLRDSFWRQGMRLPLHQGVLRDRAHAGSGGVRRAHAHHAWRRRPDRADRRLGPPVVQDRQGGHPEGLPGPAARHVLDPQRRDQRRLAGVPQGLSPSTPATNPPRLRSARAWRRSRTWTAPPSGRSRGTSA
jgi:pimeloyl-ACP methyl ester carboxylesterase